jgi:hypothetical protein
MKGRSVWKFVIGGAVLVAAVVGGIAVASKPAGAKPVTVYLTPT